MHMLVANLLSGPFSVLFSVPFLMLLNRHPGFGVNTLPGKAAEQLHCRVKFFRRTPQPSLLPFDPQTHNDTSDAARQMSLFRLSPSLILN